MPETSDNSNAAEDASEWYYQLLGLPTGPVSRDRIQWLIKNQHIVSATQIGPTKSGPWQKLADSEFKSLIVEKPKAEKKKGIRISSKSFRAPRRSRATEDPDQTEIVIDGIEIDDEVQLVTKPSAANPPLPPPPKPVPVEPEPPQPSKTVDDPDTAQGWDEIERGATASPQASAPETTPPTVVPDKSKAKPARKPKAKKDTGEGGSPDRRKLAIAGIAIAALVGLFLLVRSLTSGPDGTEAYAVFRRIGDAFEQNSETMSDNEWALFIRDSRAEVKAVLEPLREQVSSDYPQAQALMWAGDKLTIMLKGARKTPNGIRRQFDGYMAEYASEPIAEVKEKPVDAGKSDQVQQKTIVDPMFQ